MPGRLVVIALALLLSSCSDDGGPTPDGGLLDRPGPLTEASSSLEKGPGPDAVLPDGVRPDATGPGPASLCGPLPPPAGAQIKVTPAQAAQLPSIVAGAAPGTTILLEDGTYRMQGGEAQRRLSFNKPQVTLRSVSGDRSKVIIDGEYITLELIAVRASQITIADLTLKRAVDHLVHASGAPAGVNKLRLRNLHLIDSGEQFVKVNGDGAGNYVDEGILECSLLEMTATGRTHVEPNPGGCYTGGIDAHGAWKWMVRENTFQGIHCSNGSLAEHAVHFWSASRDTLVERNRIIDCARGVGFGLGQSGADRTYPDNPYPAVGYIGHLDGIIRNNLIHTGAQAAPYYDTGIELAQAHGALVLHNTVVSKPLFSSIDYRFANTLVTIRNNLTAKITLRDGAKGSVDHNLEATPASYFVAPASLDYHLTAAATGAIDQGVVAAAAGLDLDGKPHDHGLPDLGAHERRP